MHALPTEIQKACVHNVYPIESKHNVNPIEFQPVFLVYIQFD